MTIWVVTFEAFMVGFFAWLLCLLIRAGDVPRLFELLAGTAFGLLLETANVWVLHHYEYNPRFLLQIGACPDNMPVIIGMGWGLLIFSAMDISDRFPISRPGRVLMDSALCVLFDLTLDIVAIRLDGGFWNWPDMPKTLEITGDGLYGVGWQNYLGWYFAIFVMSALIRLARPRLREAGRGVRVASLFVLPVAGFACITPVLLSPVLLHKALDADPQRIRMIFLFLMIAASLAVPAWEMLRAKRGLRRKRSLYTKVFFLFFYAYFLAAMVATGLAREIPAYFGLCILFMAGTLALDLASTDFSGGARDPGKRRGASSGPA